MWSRVVARSLPGQYGVRSSGLVGDFVRFCEVEDSGLDEGLDGLLDEFRFGFGFGRGLDLVFQSIAGGGAGFGGIC